MRKFRSAVMYSARYRIYGSKKVETEKRIFVGNSFFLEDTLIEAIVQRHDDLSVGFEDIELLSYALD